MPSATITNMGAVARARSAHEVAEAELDTIERIMGPLRIRRLRAIERVEATKARLRAALAGDAEPPATPSPSIEDLARRYEGGTPCDTEERASP